MFNQDLVCPMETKTKKQEKEKKEGCKGYRENGILKNVCAGRCSAYKKYTQNI